MCTQTETSCPCPPQLPLNLGEFATFLVIAQNQKRKLPAWRIAWRLGYKLRTVRYHISNLKASGLIFSQANFRFGHQLANSYSVSPHFAPLNPSCVNRYIDEYRLLLLKAESRGAKRTWLILRILTLLAEIAHRIKGNSADLFLGAWRHLRKRKGALPAVVEVLVEAKHFFNHRGGKPPKKPLAFLIWAIA